MVFKIVHVWTDFRQVRCPSLNFITIIVLVLSDSSSVHYYKFKAEL